MANLRNPFTNQIDWSYNVEVSISTYPAHSKEECDYNASRNAWIFEPQTVTLEKWIKSILGGYAFCAIFEPNRLEWIRASGCPEGCFKETQKSYDSYIKTQYIGIDIDDCPLTPQTLMTRISNKPTFWYTTFSNGPKNKFRLIYVLSSPLKSIEGNPLVYRCLASRLGRSLEEQAGMSLGIDPVASYTVTQYMNGTDVNADIEFPGYLYDEDHLVGVGGIDSALEDFVTNIHTWFPGFDRWKHGKWYNEILDYLRNYTMYDIDKNKYEIQEKGIGAKAEPSKKLRRDLVKYKGRGFCIHYGNLYNGTIQNQTPHPEEDWLGGDPSQGIPGYWRVPDCSDIFLPYPAVKFKDGQHRKKKLFWMTILRRLMTGNNDPDIGFFWLVYDWRRGFTQKDITMTHLVEMIGAVYSRPLDELLEMKKDDVERWNKEHGNKEVIFRKGDPRSPKTITEYKQWREKTIKELLDKEWFNFERSVNENIKDIRENLNNDPRYPISFTPSPATVYRWLKKYHPDQIGKEKTLKKHESQKNEVNELLGFDLETTSSSQGWNLYQERGGTTIKSFSQFKKIRKKIFEEDDEEDWEEEEEID